jgi:hypothetical protein
MPKTRRGRPLRRKDGTPLQNGDILVARVPFGKKSYKHDFVQVIDARGIRVQAIEKKELPDHPTNHCDLMFGDFMYTYCVADPTTLISNEGDDIYNGHDYKGIHCLYDDGREDKRHMHSCAFKHVLPTDVVRDTFYEPDVT